MTPASVFSWRNC